MEIKDKHETCIKILDAIQTFLYYIKSTKESLNGIPGTFPNLKKRYIHNIEIYEKCINRLNERYLKTLNQIT